MNKLLIGLLIVAAGAGAFFLIRKKNHSTSTSYFSKEWIVGRWRADEAQPGDSNFTKYRYDFQKNGSIFRSLNDSANVDTTHFEWGKNNELVLKERASDSTGEVFHVAKLTKDSLQLQSKDSSTLLFTKLK